MVILAFLLLLAPGLAQAQVAPITPSGLHTLVSDPIAVGGHTQYGGLKGSRSLCSVLRDHKCDNVLLNEEPLEISRV